VPGGGRLFQFELDQNFVGGFLNGFARNVHHDPGMMAEK
jgi:hypothetical protein